MVNQHTQLVGTKLCAGPAHTILRIDAMLYRYRCQNRIRLAKPRSYARNGKIVFGSKRECGTRKSLKQPVEWYTRVPKCPACGARKWGRDRHRTRKELPARESCACGGYPFTHRKGSLWCHYHPDAERLWSERYEKSYSLGTQFPHLELPDDWESWDEFSEEIKMGEIRCSI